MATTISISPTALTSATLSSAGALATAAGSPTYTTHVTTVGEGLGYGEIWGLGSPAGWTWPQLNALPYPTGNGWLLDGTALEGQQIAATGLSGTIQLATSVGSLVADVYARLALYNVATGALETFGVLLAAQQTITTSVGAGIPFAASFPTQTGIVGTRLYVDVWLNITASSTGSTSATMAIRLPTTLVLGNNLGPFVYQPLPPYKASTAYSFGGFCFNDGANYLLTQKALDTVAIKETLFKIARFEGMKQTGAVTNERTIALSIRVLASSRADLEAKVDALTLAFSQMQQPLTLHSSDGRYFIADCVSLSAPLPPGAILSTRAQASFLCQQPYAFAATASGYALANQTLPWTGSGSTWQTALLALTGGGTVFSRPTLTLQNETLANAVTLTSPLTNGSPYTFLNISALPHAVAVGDRFILSASGHTQTVVASATASLGATAITLTSFNANFSYPATMTTLTKVTQITAVSVAQITDGQTLTISGLSMNPGDTLTIVCDPTAANGYTATVNGGAPLVFSGVFPIQEAGATDWQITVTSLSQPTVTLGWSWTPRWLV